MADDLFRALEMFKSGVNDLKLSNAIDGANQQVAEIKNAQMAETEKRVQLQNVSNALVTHMAAFGTPATTIQAVQGAIGPKQYTDAAHMNMDALLTGNKELGQMAASHQKFTFDLAEKTALAQAKAQTKFDPLRQMMAENTISNQDVNLVRRYKDDLDASKAPSRSQFGAWAQVQGRGERIKAILDNPNAPRTETELMMAMEGLGQMSKGGVLTKDEAHNMFPSLQLKLKQAQAEMALTGKPVAIDLSDWAKLFGNIAAREDEAAKHGMLDNIWNKVQGSNQLANRKSAQDAWRATTASAFGQVGIQVDPKTIEITKGGVKIPELQPVMDAVANAPKAVRDALKDAKSGKQDAIQFLNSFNVRADMNPSQAVEQVRKHLKNRLFQ